MNEATKRTEFYLEKTFWPFLAGALVVGLAVSINTSSAWIQVAAHSMLAITIALKTIDGRFYWQNASVVAGICGGILGLIASVVHVVMEFSVVNLFAILPTIIVWAAFEGIIAGLITELFYGIRKTRVQRKKRHKKDHSL